MSPKPRTRLVAFEIDHGNESESNSLIHPLNNEAFVE
jgi:hypothetical protein